MPDLIQPETGLPRLAYHRVHCADDAPTLMLLHGMLASRTLWSPNVAALSKVFNLVIVELPGHGDSPPMRNEDEATPDAFAKSLDLVRQSVGVARWFVCGQSLGAGITVNYCVRYPQDVIALVFTNASNIYRPPIDDKAREALKARAITLREGGAAALREERFHPRHAKYFPDDLRDILCEEADQVDGNTFGWLVSLTVPALTLRGTNLRPQCPTLLINGRFERAFQPVRDDIAQDWSGIEIVDLDGGHSINVENAQGFDHAALGFLRRFV